MRATFGLVLVAGVAAAAGVSLVLRHDPVEVPDSQKSTSLDSPPTPEGGHAGESTSSADPAPSVEVQAPLAARVDGLVARKDWATAARVLLAAAPEELRGAAVRELAFRTADGLVSYADGAADAAAVSARVDARRIYAALYLCDAATRDETRRAFDATSRLHQALIFGNGGPDTLVLRHRVQAGESVWALAKGTWKQRGVSVPPGFVLHVNGIADARRVRVGQTLRVPLEPLRVVVWKSRFELAVLLGGAPVACFPVAIGADASTPRGSFRIRDRVKDPDWYFHGRRIPHGDPQNIIGTRWIGLSGSAAAEGIGIHGTTDDASVGKAVSMGCIRLHNADVERLFDWVDAGIEVEIRD